MSAQFLLFSIEQVAYGSGKTYLLILLSSEVFVMTLIPATDNDYNASSRVIIAYINIYFDDEAEPVVVDYDNYLIDFQLLEEAGSDAADIPFGKASSNELSFTLDNTENLFSPSNRAGPYFGKIKKGVHVTPYIRTKSTEGIKLGDFYVQEWNSEITGQQAIVTCYDELHRVFNSSPFVIAPKANIQIKAAFEEIMQLNNIEGTVDATLTDSLLWWYTLDDNMETIQQLAASSIAACFMSRAGRLCVKDLTATQPLRATLTDDNQLISAYIISSVTKDYDGINIQLNTPQLSEPSIILRIKDYTAAPGTNESDPVAFSRKPVLRLESAMLNTSDNYTKLISYRHTPDNVTVTLSNTSLEDKLCNLAFTGRYLEVIKKQYYVTGESQVAFDNNYLQTKSHADKLKAVLEAFVYSLQNDLPFVDIEFRGNPLLTIGDKIRIISEKYLLDFTGYIIRMTHSYTGGLSGTMRLISSDILEV